MHGVLRRVTGVAVTICLAAAFGATDAALGDPGSRLADLGHRVADMQKKLADLESKGQTAKPGRLSAAADCSFGDPSQSFQSWGDSGTYSLVPQGDLSATSLWSLKNVDLSSDHDPFTGASGSLLFMRGDSEAVTPVTCIGADKPTLRLFLADRGGSGDATLEVRAVYDDLDGHTHELRLASLAAGDQWQPSVAVPIGVDALAAGFADGWVPVAFDFEAHGLRKGETFSLDGVYVGGEGPPAAGTTDPAAGQSGAGSDSVDAAPVVDDTSQLVDISHQVADMQKKLADLQAKGQTARDGKLSASADCGFGDPAQVFLPWGDPASYGLAPEGDLTSTSDWTLENVDLSGDHDPYTAGSTSLLFAKHDSEAVTPVMCVNLDNPSLRLFLADRGGNGRAILQVKVIYQDLGGKTHDLMLANLQVGDRWQPSVVIPIGVNLLSAASADGWTPVAFDFKVHGLQPGETFSLDGVYVDPFCRR